MRSFLFFFVMIRRPPRSTRTDTSFPTRRYSDLVKLQLIENKKLYERGVEVSPAEYVEHFRTNVQDNDNVDMHLYRLSLDPKNLLGTGVSVDRKSTRLNSSH